jgi:hypothetical protein
MWVCLSVPSGRGAVAIVVPGMRIDRRLRDPHFFQDEMKVVKLDLPELNLH